jgi:phosphate acetyltransferase
MIGVSKLDKLTNTLVEKAKTLGKTIVLPETEDGRVLKAAELVIKEGIAKLILVGNPEKIKEDAKVYAANVEGTEEFAVELQKLREKKGMTIEEAREIMLTDSRFFGAMLVRMGLADGMVAGSNSPTAKVLKAAIQVIGVKPGLKTVSSSFIMITKTPE